MTNTAINLNVVGKRHRGNRGLHGCTPRIPPDWVVWPNEAGKEMVERGAP